MIVDPYVRHPRPPTVCLLTPSGDVISETGKRVNLDRLPEDHRVWCSFDTVRELVANGVGEALCWNEEEIRWRHRRFEDGWNRRPSDVSVLRLPFEEHDHRISLGGLAGWRDWLVKHRAAPLGTMGAAAWSLLRATLEDRLWCSLGDLPPLIQTLGGRQQMGSRGQGRFDGRLAHVDLPAAYASAIGGLPYGGRWVEMGRVVPKLYDGQPCFVRATVTVDSELFGPLPRRPRRRVKGIEAAVVTGYPLEGQITGLWILEELQAAVDSGCARLRRIDRVWVHLAGGRRPFAVWWEAVQEGRAMPGLAGLLAKITGNALWGRFCMDVRAAGNRTIRSMNGKLSSRPVPVKGGLMPAHDLAETVSGRTRAQLFGLLLECGERVLCAHTDGAWIEGLEMPAGGWRLKEEARRVDVLDPQVLRYWPRPARKTAPWVVFSGQPANVAPTVFEEHWRRAGFPE